MSFDPSLLISKLVFLLNPNSNGRSVLVAIDATVGVVKEHFYASFAAGNAMRIFTNHSSDTLARCALVAYAICAEKHNNKRHSYVSAVHCLVEIVSSRVVVNVNVDFGNSGEGVHN